jgi:hypothetical protein
MCERDDILAVDLTTFRNYAAEAAEIARAAITNIVTALTSITVAIVGAAVTLGTADYKSNMANAMLSAMGGSGLAALAIVLALTVEAMLASNRANEWRTLYATQYKNFIERKPVEIPWEKLETGRLSICIHWKITLPVALFVIGLLGAGVLGAGLFKLPADRTVPAIGAIPNKD